MVEYTEQNANRKTKFVKLLAKIRTEESKEKTKVLQIIPSDLDLQKAVNEAFSLPPTKDKKKDR